MIWRVVAICILTLSVTIEVEAQSRAELALKVERLEREMIALENRLRGGAATSSATGASAGAQGSLDDRTLLADLAAKIGTVERQMRAMTGRMEELEHKQRQLDEALDLLRRELQLQQQEAADYRASQAAQHLPPRSMKHPRSRKFHCLKESLRININMHLASSRKMTSIAGSRPWICSSRRIPMIPLRAMLNFGWGVFTC
jgi:predicted  nucleic acid-binding Zn-ribbon protein